MPNKFKSRKFWISILTMVLSISGALTGIGGRIGTISCIIGAIVSPIIYILVEGNIDSKAVGMTEESIERIVEIISKSMKKDGENKENENIEGK